MDQKYQIWGTFSVKDHVRPGAFIAEVLMYDKLVVPVPPRRGVGNPEQREQAEIEWQRWVEERWDPAKQTALLGILGSLAVPIEWDIHWQQDWRLAFEKNRRNASELLARDLAYQMTAEVLLRVKPAMAEGVVAVTPYDSLNDLKQELGIQKRQLTGADGAHLPGNALTAIIGREFLVPEDPDRDDFQLLADAVSVAGSDGYREARAAFHGWLHKFINRSKETDAASIEAALKDMEKHLDALRKASARNKLWSGIRRCLFLGKTITKLAAPLAPGLAAAADCAISVGEYTTTQASNPGPNSGLPQGALLLDAQNKLGLTTKGDWAPSKWAAIFGKLADDS